MPHRLTVLLACLLATAAVTGPLAPPAPAQEIGFVEDYVLSANKDEALKQLIPGTEDYYYYLCLRQQSAGQLDQVDGVLARWLERNKNQRTPRLVEIEHRQALLKYRQAPEPSLRYLVDKLGLRFDQQREVVGRKSDLPARLDEGPITRETLLKRALAESPRLDGFAPSAVEWLITQELTPLRRRALLEMLPRADYAGIVPLIAADLAEKDSGGFGSLKIHGLLLKDQLDELAKLKADLKAQQAFVHLYMTRLRPGDDANWREDPAEELAYMDRLWALVKDLEPAFNSLKAYVLGNRLRLDLARGSYDKDLFLEYLKLPRNAPYVRPEYLQAEANRRFVADCNQDLQPQTLLRPIGDGEPMVRAYLAHFFLTEDSYEPYAKYLADAYLKQVFAETKLLAGLGDAEKWTAMLSPEQFKALKDRVDLDFAPTAERYFAAAAKVQLDVDVKNARDLIVKVYRINAVKYYQQKAQAVPLDLDLDGLVANEQKTYTYTEDPIRRVRRRFDFPALAGPGVYVVELIGNGKRSRALVRKGRLDFLVRTTPAGQEFTILDEAGAKLPDGQLWLAGHVYAADKDGHVMVPFSNAPGKQTIVLISGQAASLASFEQQGEAYSLPCGFYVDREQLLRGQNATLLVRPRLELNGQPVSLALLKDVELAITSTDRDGVAATQRVKDFAIFEDRESTYELRTPDRLAGVRFTLSGKVQNLSANHKDDLKAERAFALNGIDNTPEVADLHLLRADGKYALEMLGRNGEALSDRPVQLTLMHRDFTKPVIVTLKSDEKGRVELGAMKEITLLVTGHGPNMQVHHSWRLDDEHRDWPGVMTGTVGQALTLPYAGQAKEAVPAELSLLEYREGSPVADWFKALRVGGGMLQITGLPAGDYKLVLKCVGREVAIHVTAGKAVDGFWVSPTRQLQQQDDKPVQIVDVTADNDTVKVRLTNATNLTRVHVVAARFMPEYELFDNLHPFAWPGVAEMRLAKIESHYQAGRAISDEYRYILDRQSAHKYPGNMLIRPSLILNPWSIRKTETGVAKGKEGQDFDKKLTELAAAHPDLLQYLPPGRPMAGNYSNLDFLANTSVVLANLRPDKDGVVAVPRKALLDKQFIRVLAVDTEHAACREVSLAEVAPALRDIRLDAAMALDPQKHFTQVKSISVATAGKPFVLRDVTAGRFEVYDSLDKAQRLLFTLNSDATFAEFAFILEWPKLKDEEKRAKYSKYACHELSFFLSRRDPEFFRTAILPYLKNKKDKTFLDQWLCGEDLGEYLKPWRHQQLNVVERALLAQRIEADRPAAARHEADLFELLPPDVDRFNMLFETALGLNSLRPSAPAGKDLKELGKGEPAAEVPAEGLAAVAEGLKEEKTAALRSRAVAATPAPKPMAPPPATLAPAAGAAPAAGEAGRRYDDRAERRKQAQQFYRAVGKVEEWAENNYYHLPVAQATADLVTVNAFWRDYAAWNGQGEFLSTSFAEAGRNVHEMLLALAVLDLPLEAPKHQVSLKGSMMTITPGGSAIVFHEEITPVATVPKTMPILVSQNYYRFGERYRQVGPEQVDNFVTDEFLVAQVYGCHVVVTNPTSSKRKLQVLMQVPRGAIPVAKGRYTQALYVELEPYRTQTFDTFFYFPADGQFGQFPVHVAQGGELVAFAAPAALKAVRELTAVDKTSWDFISQNGNNDEVLGFLKANNLGRLDLSRIAWRMGDKAVYRSVLDLLTGRHVYNDVLWSYGLKHDDPAAVRQYLQFRDDFLAACGKAIDCPLLTIDPVVRRAYQHIEYWPLVNARQHRFGPKWKILVERMLGQYTELLEVLRYRSELNDEDLMALTYYLLLQDRVDEAQGFFKRVNVAALPEKLQYDYFAAYISFYNEAPDAARKLAEKYKDHPVERWRDLFGAVLAQAEEIEGKAPPKVLNPEQREEVLTHQAEAEASFDFTVENKKITLNYQNLKSVTVNYYLMDIELMFSRQPFVQEQGGGQFAYIQPNQTQEVPLPADKKAATIDLPAELLNRNVMVEVVAGGKTRTQAYYSNSLVAQVTENYGQLRVTDAAGGKPLAKAYVKVYAQMPGGHAEFYKDGYTDLRGRFDYTSLNTDQLGAVEKFAILILSEADGSVVREAKPPKR
jgi:hypothetical protein